MINLLQWTFVTEEAKSLSLSWIPSTSTLTEHLEAPL